MNITERLQQLLDNLFRLLFTELLVWHALETGVQTLTTCILHDEVHVLGCVDRLVQLNDGWVVQTRQYFYFTDRLLFTLKVKQLISIVLFYCYLLASLAPHALFYLGICSSTK